MPPCWRSLLNSSRDAMSRRIPSESWLVQFQPTAPGMWLCSKAVVSTSTSTNRTFGSSRCCCAQSAETRTSVAYPLTVIRWLLSLSSAPASMSLARGAITPRERVQPLATRGRLALRLADDPRVDPARVLDRHRWSVDAVVEDDPRRVPVVGHPVGLQRDQDVADDRTVEQPVDVGGVEPVDDVVEPDRAPALETRDEADDSERRKRVARFGDGRRAQVCRRQGPRGRPKRGQTGGRDRGRGHRRNRTRDRPIGPSRIPDLALSGSDGPTTRVAARWLQVLPDRG